MTLVSVGFVDLFVCWIVCAVFNKEVKMGLMRFTLEVEVSVFRESKYVQRERERERFVCTYTPAFTNMPYQRHLFRRSVKH